MFKSKEENLKDFVSARYGLFIHYGLYSLLGRGEWCLNRELIDIDEYKRLASSFKAENFNADKICGLAKTSGMSYICLTTMHHDGFMLYDSELSDFCTVKTACGRDLVAETIAAARKHGLRVHLYHSLNHWTCDPSSSAALESKDAYEKFIAFTFARIKELVTKYNPMIEHILTAPDHLFPGTVDVQFIERGVDEPVKEIQVRQLQGIFPIRLSSCTERRHTLPS